MSFRMCQIIIVHCFIMMYHKLYELRISLDFPGENALTRLNIRLDYEELLG